MLAHPGLSGALEREYNPPTHFTDKETEASKKLINWLEVTRKQCVYASTAHL